MDREKLVRIWRALEGAKAEREGWLHVADIARRTGINPVTVRWYLDHYLDQAIEEQQLLPGIRLRLVRLKPGYDLLGYLKARESIRNIKGV
jgi:hypothetical protein